ncbi:hypothetical protein QBC46DRAFT_255841 [Diplogelasinospora grovesii]|uniref:Uncharacterized protein n=1 Tax=Diplogelasinospora grovesii TaxID=303347 RepID=A0AAN6S798_9PEZI|nr:hypothetical protein QBC46DRAFT_255841 [Diplogelasinospora grovesii]
MLGSRPCQLVPPCKDGNHTRSPGIPRTTSPIGKYFFTEGALKHDLQALRRGAVYIKDEFYKRAKAWYKAEIDRPKPETAPTRVQPSRSAKRKIADYAVNTSRPTSSGTAAKAAIIPNPTTDTPEYTPETKGDYELAEYDWQQFQNHNSGEHPPALSHIQLALLGLDVAYFSIRLEKAVNSKVTDLLHNKRTSALDLELGPGRSYMCAAGAAFHNHHLDSHSTPPTAPSEEEEGDREEKEFKPAAAFSPGEDWRPPTTTTTSGTVRNGLSFWAVGCRRSSSDKNAKAPEAEMETSPTLGKWPFNTENAPADSFKDLPLEDYTESKSIVEVSGLKFAVDVCATWDLSEQEELEGGRQGACIVML